MKKVAIMVLVALFAASPAVAAKKKSKKMAAPAAPAAQDLNANGKRLVVDAIPSMLPGWAIPLYMSSQKSQGGKSK